jgi:hypothetical protein
MTTCWITNCDAPSIKPGWQTPRHRARTFRLPSRAGLYHVLVDWVAEKWRALERLRARYGDKYVWRYRLAAPEREWHDVADLEGFDPTPAREAFLPSTGRRTAATGDPEEREVLTHHLVPPLARRDDMTTRSAGRYPPAPTPTSSRVRDTERQLLSPDA